MNSNLRSDIWLKAAVIGSVWGASEIVLGSFLHNLRIPFSGNLLTTIGIVIMIAGHRLWPERGLFWRAGLICVAMKTLSPSPVIFGPMLAIFMQSISMQAGVLLGGRTVVGYLIGGGLAMAWNIVQRILTALLVYGMSIVELYQSLVDYLYSNIGMPFTGYWMPVALLFGLFFLGGVAAAIAGMLISRSAASVRSGIIFRSPDQFTDTLKLKSDHQHPFSVYRLTGILLLLFGGLYVVYAFPLYISVVYVAGFIALITVYDKRLVYRFAYKPGFWISLLIITTLTGFFLGGKQGGPALTVDGLLIGVEMNLRAIVVIAGFGAVSVQLRNPVLMCWFENWRMKHFFSAVRISFQTIPFIITMIPKGRAWKNPVTVLSGMIGQMDGYLDMMKKEERKRSTVFIITGKRGTGKTTVTGNVIERLRTKGFTVAGILQPEYISGGKRAGFYVKDIVNGTRMILCIREASTMHRTPVLFRFNDDAFKFGKSVLSVSNVRYSDLVVIDEIGPLELEGNGWADAITLLRTQWNGPMIWIVREKLIDGIVKKWNVDDYTVFDINYTDAVTIANRIGERTGLNTFSIT